jgi:hypothetical protein
MHELGCDYKQDNQKKCAAITKLQVQKIVGKRSWLYTRWPLNPIVRGEGYNWIVTFEPAPLSFHQRLFNILFYWDLTPKLPQVIYNELTLSSEQLNSEQFNSDDNDCNTLSN